MKGLIRIREIYLSGFPASAGILGWGPAALVILSLALMAYAASPVHAQKSGGASGSEAVHFEAERMLSSILRSAPGGIGVVVDRVIVQVNDHILNLTGYSREELLGVNARIFYPTDEDYEYVGREKYRQISDKGTGRVETRWKTKDGALLDVILSSTPLDAANLEAGVVFTVIDITEKNSTARKLQDRTRMFLIGSVVLIAFLLVLVFALARANTARRKITDALRAKTEELDRYFLSSLDLLCIADTGGRFLRLNPEWEKVLGYPVEDLEGKLFLDFVHPDDRNGTLEAVSRLQAQESVLNFRNRFLCRDGSFRWIEWRSKPVGTVIYSVARDITDRIETEAKLRFSEERFNLAMGAVNDGIWDWNLSSGIVFFDARYYTMSGYEPDEFPHRFEEFRKRIHSEDEEPVLAAVNKHLAGETPAFDIEFRFLRKDGSWMWIRGRGKTVAYDENGRPSRMIGTHTDLTDKKAAEEELRKSRTMLNLVLNTIPQAVFWKDREGRYLGCNRAFALDAGRKEPEEMVGLNDFAMAWRLQAEAYRADDRRLIETDESKVNYEEPMTFSDKPVKWLRTSKIPLKDSDDNIYGILGMYEDITEWKRTQEQLQQANHVVENSPAVLFRWKAAEGWPILMVTENVQQFGFTREELLSGKIPFGSLIHPEDLQRIGVEVRVHTEKGLDNFVQEYRIVTRDGTVRWVDDRTKVIRGPDGLPTEYQGVMIDITERKQAEAERERSINFQSALLDAIPTAVFYKDREGRYQGCNKVFTEFMGVTTEQLRGKTERELWPGDLSDTYHRKDLELMALARRQTYEYKVKDFRGVERPVIFSKDVFRDELGEIAGIVGAFLDITKRRKAEDALKALNETLEQRIGIRTRELDERNADLMHANEELRMTLAMLHDTQDSLVQSEKLAALGQLIAGIAHELNTPLGAIVSSNQSMIQLIGNRLETASRAIAGLSQEVLDWFNPVLKKALSEHAAITEPTGLYRKRKKLAAKLSEGGVHVSERLLEALIDLRLDDDPSVPALIRNHPDVEDAVEALDTLISIKTMSDVIALAADKCANVVSALLYHVRSEGGEDAFTQVEIAKELDSLLTLYTNKIKQGVILEKEYRSRGIVRGNRNQLNQVWMNLIQNALQAMEYKGTLGLSIEERGGGIAVAVKDSGCGVPEHLMKKIFEPFFTTKKSGEGTGLGLDICTKIVDRHGGKIELESEPGNTIFRVILPSWKDEGG